MFKSFTSLGAKKIEWNRLAAKKGKEIGDQYQYIWSDENSAVQFINSVLSDSNSSFIGDLHRQINSRKKWIWQTFVGSILIGIAYGVLTSSFFDFMSLAFVFSISSYLIVHFYCEHLEYFSKELPPIVRRNALIRISDRRLEAQSHQPDSSSGKSKIGLSPMPEPLPYGVSHRGAEELVAAWMQYLGDLDAQVTRFSSDGGIDVESANYVAQVKNYKGSVPVAEVRQLQGVASVDGRKPLFFTSGSYTIEGIKFGESIGMGMFVYNAERGTLTASNSPAISFLKTGF